MNDNKIATESQVMDQATADRMSATLGIATRLSEGLMPQGEPEQPTESPQAPETAPEQAEPTEPQETPAQPDMEGMIAKKELNITKQLDSLRKEIKEDSQKEIEGIKQDLKEALQDDENTEETKTQKTS